ncbi:MAG: glycosyltransferase family 4 protein [Burkholderiaceae bacterium]
MPAERRAFLLLPGDPATVTGGYLYDRRIVAGLRAQGWTIEVMSPGDGFPLPDAATRNAAAAVVEALPDDALVIADGLAFGVLPELAEAHARRLRWVALVHHPLALETGLGAEEATMLQGSERRALAVARQVVVTSRSTARALADYDVPAASITVIEPGTDPAALAEGSGSDALALLCVATLTPRKGHALLLEALAGLADRRWTLHCVGNLERDHATAASLHAASMRLGIADRVVWHGEQREVALDALYAKSDVFVLPSFHEGYGMAFAEALARGLPIVGTDAGAIADTVPRDAGTLVPPGDVPALRDALRRVMDEPAHRAALATGARAARQHLSDWSVAAARFAAVLESVK